MITIPSHISNSIPSLSPYITSWTSSLSTGNLPAGLIYDWGLFCVSIQEGNSLWRQLEAVIRCIPRNCVCVSYIKLHSKFFCTVTQAHHDTSWHIRLHWPSDPMISIAFFVQLYFEHQLLFFYLSTSKQYIWNNFTFRFQTSHWVKNVIST